MVSPDFALTSTIPVFSADGGVFRKSDMTQYYVTSGVTSTGIVLENSDMIVYAGGTAIRTHVTTSGTMEVENLAERTTVNSGGKMYQFAGTATVTTLSGSGSFLEVYNGGTSISATVDSGAALDESGKDSATAVNFGGVSTKASIMGQGSESIYSYGQQLAGGTAKKAMVGSGGIQNVNVSGTAIGTTVHGSGLQFLESTGVSKGTKVLKGGTEQMTGGTSIGTKISYGGSEIVTSGASAAGTTFGIAKNTLLAGTLELQAGAKATGHLTFSGGRGDLIIDTTKMPTATISGFAAGDAIKLAGISYSASDSVGVTKAGVVTVSAGGHKYSLHIAGATVSSTAFTFGPGAILTTSTPAMAFLAPAAVTALATPPPAANPEPHLMPNLGAAGAPESTAVISAPVMGAMASHPWVERQSFAVPVISAHGGGF
jgi:fibronectin-binding autotransporter adhesin